MAVVEMNANLRTWLEATIATHLRGSAPLEEVRDGLLRRLLVRLLYHWRYEVPPEFEKELAGFDQVTFAVVLRDSPAFDGVASLEITAHQDDICAALQAGGDWNALSKLPRGVWDWIHHATGLEYDQWETLPQTAQRTLDSFVMCPDCGRKGQLAELKEMVGVADPYGRGSSGALQFVCPKCGASLAFHAETSTMAHLDSRWPSLGKWAGWFFIACVVAVPLWFVIARLIR